MSARRCPHCEICYPYTIDPCEACRRSTEYLGWKEPDSNWQALVKQARQRIENAERAIPRLKIGVVRDAAGRLWVHRVDLDRAGWLEELEAFQLLEVDSVNGEPIIIEVQGADAPRRRWWVEYLEHASAA